MKPAVLGLLAETPIHPGAGRGMGVVDLPVAREAGTHYPVLVGSCLKGALRDKAEPVRVEADVMTPHYAGWTQGDPPGDWRSPKPIAFLATARETRFLFGVVPGRSAAEGDPDDLDVVVSWLTSAVLWAGGGAKTAVG